MCMAIYKPAGERIKKAILRNCWDNNSDGAGFMFADKGRLIIRKGFMVWRDFNRAFRAAEQKYSSSGFVLHFRWATHGTVSQENTHPFRVSDSVGFVHNGVLSDMGGEHFDTRSDTMIFRDMVLRSLRSDFLHDVGTCKLLESYAKANSSRFIFLDSAGTVRIFNEDSGEYCGKVWFSGQSYKYNTTKWKRSTGTVTYRNEGTATGRQVSRSLLDNTATASTTGTDTDDDSDSDTDSDSMSEAEYNGKYGLAQCDGCLEHFPEQMLDKSFGDIWLCDACQWEWIEAQDAKRKAQKPANLP